MQLTGLKYGRKILEMVEFPVSPTLTEEASMEEVAKLMEAHGGRCVVKPFFMGGVGKKGKAGLVRIAKSVHEAMDAKKDLYFAKHTVGNHTVQANGVTFEGFIESEAEIYVSITASTEVRMPVMTIIVEGGVDVEDVAPEKKANPHLQPHYRDQIVPYYQCIDRTELSTPVHQSSGSVPPQALGSVR
jgi:succinyl-CoA synthetase beta subunit